MSQSNCIAIYRTDNGYLFRVVGRGTLHESPAMRTCICEAVESGAEVVLDLSECRYLDSTFLGCLVIMHQCAQKCDGAFSILADESSRKRLLGTCHLDRMLRCVDHCPPNLGSAVTLQLTDLKGRELGQHLLDAHRSLAELGGPLADSFGGIVERLTEELNDSQ